MFMRIQSNNIVLLDTTDTKKVDIHISSNHPTIQIYNPNDSQESFTPDWSKVPLELKATVYADSTPITEEIGANFQWSRKIGDTVDVLASTTNTLTISENDLAPPIVMVQYICSITYNNNPYENIITFARTDVGKDGENGTSAPAVKAQYSVDGKTGWSTTLNTLTHKYVRFSYDNGATWTAAIKISGEDGKSVAIKGTATSVAAVSDTNYYTVTYGGASVATAVLGDSYLYNGDLYVCSEQKDGVDYFINVGKIQGPQGQKGDSYYLFIRYADNTNGSGISTSPNGKSYIGFYRSSVNQVPTDVSFTTWNWAKFVGEDAKSVTLTSNAQVFKIDKSNTMTPTTITVTAQAVNTTIPSNGWTYSTDGGKTFSSTSPAGVSRNGDVVTLTGVSMTSGSIVVKASDGVYSDSLTVYKVSDGSDGKPGVEGKPAPIAFLTNENITFAANASGQVTGTTIYCNVVAYTGTTQVAPTVGTILSTELPTGMSIGTSTTVSNQVQIPIVIANNATLGSTQNINGVINIPVTSPVSTTLQLTWSKINSGVKGDKGDSGVGIRSTTVSYGVSDSASTKPTDTLWQSTIPVVAEGKYLWTRTITDYTDDAIPDTVTYTYAKQGDTGSSGSSVTVSSIQYKEGTSATTAPTGTWSDSVVSVSEGKYLWTKTAFSDGKIAYGVAKQGQKGDKGDTGRGVSKIAEYYLATTSSSGVTTNTSGWTTTVQTIDATKKYLWNYELITYTDTTTSTTTPVIIGVFGNTGATGATGKGIKAVTEYYLATASVSGVTTSTTGWTTTMQTLTATNKYLWNYELITYTDNSTATISPVIIGVYGDKGVQGDRGAGISSVTVTYGVSTDASTQPTSWQTTIPTVAEGSYLWTRTVTDYTDASIADTVTLTYAKQGAKGSTGSAGTSVTVSSIQYQAGTSATTAPTSTWSNSVVSVAEGSYLWTKTTFSDGKVAYGVAKQGAKGSTGVSAVAFQVYAPDGYLLTKDLPSLTLQTFAYEGSTAITSGATYQWAQYVEGVWENISGATTQTLTVTKESVVKSKSYKCTMTYKSKQYVSTATVQDKTDIYDSLIQVTSKYSSTNKLYWILYSTVYSEEGEYDKLLGPIGTVAPTSPTSGAYWYKIDESNYTVTLMKYSGTAWAETTDKQELVYDWFLFNDIDHTTPLGAQNKVKIITSNDFNKVCSVQCNVFDSESTPITYSNQVLSDPSDPIVSSVEPINPVHGQLWIKTNANGLYTLLAWDSSLERWIVSETDSRVKVHISKPASYEVGDVWVVGSDYEPIVYINGVAQTTKYLTGTMLKAQYSSQSYKDSDWVEALNYKKEIDGLKAELDVYNQYFDFDEDGLTMYAKKKSGVVSEFKTKLTNTELGFYQGENKVAHINNNQLNISKAEITNGMTITGTAPVLEIGNFVIMQESNGSLSIGLKG